MNRPHGRKREIALHRCRRYFHVTRAAGEAPLAAHPVALIARPPTLTGGSTRLDPGRCGWPSSCSARLGVAHLPAELSEGPNGPEHQAECVGQGRLGVLAQLGKVLPAGVIDLGVGERRAGKRLLLFEKPASSGDLPAAVTAETPPATAAGGLRRQLLEGTAPQSRVMPVCLGLRPGRPASGAPAP